MSQIDLGSILGKMHALDLQTTPSPEQAVGATSSNTTDFSSLLEQSLASISGAQQHAGQLAASFERGDAGADLGQTMVAMNKADLALNMATQVRNKVTDAYDSVMQMSV